MAPFLPALSGRGPWLGALALRNDELDELRRELRCRRAGAEAFGSDQRGEGFWRFRLEGALEGWKAKSLWVKSDLKIIWDIELNDFGSKLSCKAARCQTLDSHFESKRLLGHIKCLSSWVIWPSLSRTALQRPPGSLCSCVYWYGPTSMAMGYDGYECMNPR